MSKKISGLFALLAFLGLSLFLINCGSSSSRPAGVLYVLSQGASNVGSYAIDLGNGRLSLINKTAEAGATPSSILLAPDGKVAFVLNTGSNSITAYTTNADGSLSAPTKTDLPVQNSVAMARDAAGTILLVVSQGTIPPPGDCPKAEPNTDCPALIVFTTQPGSATLTQAGDPFALDNVPTSVAASIVGTFGPGPGVAGTLVHITSNFDLTSQNISNAISEYVVDAAGATTGPLRSPPDLTASNPSSVLAIQTTPTGGAGGVFVYVTNLTTDNVNVFQLCTVPNGATCTTDDVTNAKLNAVGSPVSVALDPVAMTVDPTNNFLYVVNQGDNSVSGFRINQTTGALSGLTPLKVSTGSVPVAISMHSSGKFLFVSNNASSNVSAFNVSTTNGALSNATNITSSAQPSGLAAK